MKQKEVPSRELLVNKSNQNTNSITRDRLTAVYHHCHSTRITSLCSEGGLLTGCPSWRAKNCMVNQVESQPTESTDDAEARADFWSIQGDFIYRHHNEPRVQLHVPKEETFPISYSTGMHWCCEVYTYWSGCVTRKEDSRLLESRFEQAFVRFLERNHKIHSIGAEGTDKDWNDCQTRFVRGQKYGRKFVQPLREKQEWAKEDPKLVNVRNLKEFFLIDPDDKEYSEIL